ncbi:hypothetical protein CKF94_23220 [Vibrio coralliilyticus]|nr:hypothetical protein CKF94_23220 [Vibrio coralliilyticus]
MVALKIISVTYPQESEHNKAFKSDSQRLAVSLRSSIAKRCSHLNAALGNSQLESPLLRVNW